MSESTQINFMDSLRDMAKKELVGRKGSIIINYAGETVQYMNNDIIGNALQAWLPVWFQRNDVELINNEHTQEFPDFIAVDGENHYDVEIKCWNYNASPAFDLANFHSLINVLYVNPRKIMADYLILPYQPTEHGFEVVDVYLKKIWEITKPSRNYPIGLQVKRDQPYAVRPFPFHRQPENSFSNRKEFVEALAETLKLFPPKNDVPYEDAEDWLATVSINFCQITGEEL